MNAMNTAHRKPLTGTALDWFDAREAVDAIQPDAWAKLPYTAKIHAENLVRRADPAMLDAYLGQLIERRSEDRQGDPLAPVFAALADGDSLILFPEGTRTAERLPQAFRGGLFRIAEAWPGLSLLPAYLDTLHRSLPKGSLLPLPLDCNVHIGAALPSIVGETREAFLERARAAVVTLAPQPEPTAP